MRLVRILDAVVGDREVDVPKIDVQGYEFQVFYNTARPHSALAYQTPAAFAAKLTATGLHAALTDSTALRPVAQPAQTGLQLPEALKATG